MGLIAIVSSDRELNRCIERHCRESADGFLPQFLAESNHTLQYLSYELPEICVLNLSDAKLPIEEIVDAVTADPWLHYGGIIGIHDEGDDEELQSKLQACNLVALVQRGEVDNALPPVLNMLARNRQFLFQRELQQRLLTHISGSCVFDNEPRDATTYARLLTNYLFNANYIGADQRDGLLIALIELLMNAIEHGNCGVSHQEKTAWLESGRSMLELIRKRNRDPDIARRKVYLYYHIDANRSSFRIRDQGQGFDWRAQLDGAGQGTGVELHGRGLTMARHCVSNLRHNDRGNEVEFDVPHQPERSNVRPAPFAGETEVVFDDGETVFTEGDASDSLYYIVAGKFRVISGGKVLSVLLPNDLFLGEMSFLLNQRRSATIKAWGRGRLLQISKESFVRAVRQQPHYGIFLARLLAQRLDRINREMVTASRS